MMSLGYSFWSEWELYEKVDFDGANEIATVYPHVTNFDIREDLYSAWVRWFSMKARNYDRYDLAMERKGLDDIPGGQTGDSYFLRNGWKLVVDFSKVAVTGILYSRDYASAYFAPDLDIQFAAQVSALVNTVTTVENVVTGDIGTIEPKINEIHGQVPRQLWLDESLDDPPEANGYQQTPYDVLNDAVDDLEAGGHAQLNTKSDMVLDRDLKNIRLVGIGVPSPKIDAQGNSLKGMKLWNMQLEGLSIDPFYIQQSYVLQGAGLQGTAELCVFKGDVILTGNLEIINGVSGKEGAEFIWLDVNGHLLQVSRWTRSLGISNMTDGIHTIAMRDGQLHLDAGCSGGTIFLRGSYSSPPNIDPAAATIVIDQTEKAQLLGTETFPHV